MEDNKLKKSQKIILGIMFAFVLFGVVVSILTIKIGSHYTIPAVLNLIIYAAMIIYVLFLFNKPHGNHLKWVLLLYAFSVLAFAVQSAENSSVFSFLMGGNALLVAYMAGRLGKLKSNIRLIWIIIIIFVGNVIAVETNSAFRDIITLLDGTLDKFVYIMLPFSKLIQFIPLAYSYVVRYHQHITAGKKVDAEIEAKCEKY